VNAYGVAPYISPEHRHSKQATAVVAPRFIEGAIDRARGRLYILLGYNIAWSAGKVISRQPFAGRGKLVEGMPEGDEGALYAEFLPANKFSGYVLEPVPHKGRQCDGA
jgi:hypothetical protein